MTWNFFKTSLNQIKYRSSLNLRYLIFILSEFAGASRGLIYNYLCNQCLSPLKLWVLFLLRWGVLDITLYDKVCQWLATDRWFSLGTPVSSTNENNWHDITEILLKVALNTIALTLTPEFAKWCFLALSYTLNRLEILKLAVIQVKFCINKNSWNQQWIHNLFVMEKTIQSWKTCVWSFCLYLDNKICLN